MISIISTFYNDKEMAKLVMDSVLSQTYDNIEHVITDGGSSDGSVELYESYEKKYAEAGKKLVWKSEKDKGLYDGFNKAANLATGDYILVCTDPYVNSTIIEQMMTTVTEGDYDYIYGGMIFQKDGKIVRIWSGKPGNWRLGWLAATPTLLMKKSVWEKHGEFDIKYRSAADYKVQISIFKDKSLRSTSLQKPLINYYAGGTSNNGIKGKMVSIKECGKILRECHVHFGWFTNMCKTFIALFAYTFASHKKTDFTEQ